MAPELARTGKANTSTDIYAFGIFMLEVACGRKPIDPRTPPEEAFLADWITGCWDKGDILTTTDKRLEKSFVGQQAELVLKLGLLCSHPVAAARPSMSSIISYLDGVASLPDGLSSVIKAREFLQDKKSDSSIKIPLPINLRKDSEWIGVACCCIFVNNDAPCYDEKIRCGAFIYCGNSEQASLNGSNFRGRHRRQVDWWGYILLTGRNQPITKDHLFLRYWSRDKLFPFSLEDKYGDCELEVSFLHPCKPNAKVKCGVRKMYEKDLEEIKELQCHTTLSSLNFEHIHQHSAHNHRSVGSTSHIKQKM